MSETISELIDAAAKAEELYDIHELEEYAEYMAELSPCCHVRLENSQVNGSYFVRKCPKCGNLEVTK